MDARIKRAIAIMRESIADQLSIRMLSRRVNLSPSRLRQLFNKETGRSPMGYLSDVRMQKAGELLRSTFLSIKEVTFLCGVKDVSHFTRDFKKKYGLTPSEFRARSES